MSKQIYPEPTTGVFIFNQQDELLLLRSAAGVRVGVGVTPAVPPLQPPSMPEMSATAASPAVIQVRIRSLFLCSVWPILVHLRVGFPHRSVL